MTPTKPTIDVHLEGLTEDRGAVPLGVFRTFCETLEECLRKVEEAEHVGKMVYLIDDLRSGSAVVSITARVNDPIIDNRHRVFGVFQGLLEGIERGTETGAELPASLLLAFRKLTGSLNRRLVAIRIGRLNLTSSFATNIDRILTPTIATSGSVKGRLERLNLHNSHEFVVYSPLGYVVKCVFPESLFSRVQQAIRSTVNVSGKLHYRPDMPYPDKVHVEEIDILPPNSTLPKLSEMKGTWKDATGGLGVTEFLRNLRDA
jgi:hypothetical protein